MRFLVTSDTHFSDNPRDAYRFKLFDFLSEQKEKHKVNYILHLGDVTEKKNDHSASLVNSIIKGLKTLDAPIYIDRGNHDGLNPSLPYFHFLNEIPGIIFCTDFCVSHKLKLAFIPHQRDESDFHKYIKQVPDGYIALLHQTVTGAISETGQQMTGFSVPPNRARAIYSGDIHNPHKVGSVSYIGSPYPVRMGDNYKARVLLLDVNENNIVETDLHFDAPKKLHLHIRDVSEIPKLTKGDQVKITLELTRAEIVEWANHKKGIMDHCQQNGIEVHGFELKKEERKKRTRIENNGASRSKSTKEFFLEFCNAEKLSDQVRQTGATLLDVQN